MSSSHHSSEYTRRGEGEEPVRRAAGIYGDDTTEPIFALEGRRSTTVRGLILAKLTDLASDDDTPEGETGYFRACNRVGIYDHFGPGRACKGLGHCKYHVLMVVRAGEAERGELGGLAGGALLHVLGEPGTVKHVAFVLDYLVWKNTSGRRRVVLRSELEPAGRELMRTWAGEPDRFVMNTEIFHAFTRKVPLPHGRYRTKAQKVDRRFTQRNSYVGADNRNPPTVYQIFRALDTLRQGIPPIFLGAELKSFGALHRTYGQWKPAAGLGELSGSEEGPRSSGESGVDSGSNRTGAASESRRLYLQLYRVETVEHRLYQNYFGTSEQLDRVLRVLQADLRLRTVRGDQPVAEVGPRQRFDADTVDEMRDRGTYVTNAEHVLESPLTEFGGRRLTAGTGEGGAAPMESGHGESDEGITTPQLRKGCVPLTMEWDEKLYKDYVAAFETSREARLRTAPGTAMSPALSFEQFAYLTYAKYLLHAKEHYGETFVAAMPPFSLAKHFVAVPPVKLGRLTRGTCDKCGREGQRIRSGDACMGGHWSGFFMQRHPSADARLCHTCAPFEIGEAHDVVNHLVWVPERGRYMGVGVTTSGGGGDPRIGDPGVIATPPGTRTRTAPPDAYTLLTMLPGGMSKEHAEGLKGVELLRKSIDVPLQNITEFCGEGKNLSEVNLFLDEIKTAFASPEIRSALEQSKVNPTFVTTRILETKVTHRSTLWSTFHNHREDAAWIQERIGSERKLRAFVLKTLVIVARQLDQKFELLAVKQRYSETALEYSNRVREGFQVAQLRNNLGFGWSLLTEAFVRGIRKELQRFVDVEFKTNNFEYYYKTDAQAELDWALMLTHVCAAEHAWETVQSKGRYGTRAVSPTRSSSANNLSVNALAEIISALTPQPVGKVGPSRNAQPSRGNFRLSSSRTSSPAKKKTPTDRGTDVCRACGEQGHWARECPHKAPKPFRSFQPSAPATLFAMMPDAADFILEQGVPLKGVSLERREVLRSLENQLRQANQPAKGNMEELDETSEEPDSEHATEDDEEEETQDSESESGGSDLSAGSDMED